MKKKPFTTDAAIELRHQAEAKLSEQKQPAPPGAMTETQRLIHELQVHQIELEMQNEELRRTQIELQASQSHYFDIYDLAPVGYLILSEKSMIVETNLTAANLLGMARDLLVHCSFPLFILAEDRIIYHQYWRKLVETSSPQACELRLKRKDGSHFWAQVEMRVGPDANGDNAQRVVVSDISQRKQVEQALIESESRFRNLTNTAPVLIWQSNTHASCDYFNQPWLDFTGRTLEQELGNGWAEGVHPDDYQRRLDIYLAAFKARREFLVEYRLRRNNGKYGWLVDNGVPRFTVDGVFLGFIGSCIDISDRKHAEEVSNQTQQRLSEVLENSLDASYKRNLLTNAYDYLSPVFSRISGYSPDEMKTLPIEAVLSLMHPDDLTEINRVISLSTLDTQAAPYQVDYRFLHKDGRYHWFHDQFIVMRDSAGRAIARIGSVSDVTERKQAEQALQEAHALLEQRVGERTADLQAANIKLAKVMQLKDEFLAIMSHELRTPLTSVLGLSETLQMRTAGPLNEKQNTYLDHIYNSSQRLLELLNNILDLSKLINGELELSTAACSLAKICQASLQTSAAAALAKNLHASFSITPNQIMLQTDERRLKQIILHLLNNAIKFTPPGGSFGIQVLGNQNTGQVQITIWDTGIGIKAEDQTRLFQSFVQLDARLARQYNGTGLGLALVQRLAELHGGSVSVESNIGRGSRFTVTLPWLGQQIYSALESQEN